MQMSANGIAIVELLLELVQRERRAARATDDGGEEHRRQHSRRSMMMIHTTEPAATIPIVKWMGTRWRSRARNLIIDVLSAVSGLSGSVGRYTSAGDRSGLSESDRQRAMGCKTSPPTEATEILERRETVIPGEVHHGYNRVSRRQREDPVREGHESPHQRSWPSPFSGPQPPPSSSAAANCGAASLASTGSAGSSAGSRLCKLRGGICEREVSGGE